MGGVWLRVPAWMPVAPHHGIRWVIWYGLAVSDGDGDMRQKRESWVAQGVRSYGKRRKGLAFQQMQLRSRHRQRMNRLAALVEGLASSHVTGLRWLRGNALLQCEQQRAHREWHAAGT